MAGLFTVRVRVAGATQFVSTSPIVTFNEFTDLNGTSQSTTARIHGYAYNSAGAAHNVRLVLTPPAAATGADEDIILEAPSSTINSFSNLCGPGGIIVPRQYGIVANAQPPAGNVITGETYQLFFSTTGKADAGTLYVWYSVEEFSA